MNPVKAVGVGNEHSLNTSVWRMSWPVVVKAARSRMSPVMSMAWRMKNLPGVA
jgi:hypothetical protein